eukprot:CAMPEP_0118886948 /NCGR_PEP_ID=MMETSP1163-20130328/24848_1 /TAXON_ID=124430 /ORGANISM="Phaeomonas parva, Strain CCMP2877" /LENGTH=265 /DNA_ID=CAMNT_0006825279 /DNA_START=107 /DNA_END=900 /DNA_ORIENTATION=+
MKAALGATAALLSVMAAGGADDFSDPLEILSYYYGYRNCIGVVIGQDDPVEVATAAGCTVNEFNQTNIRQSFIFGLQCGTVITSGSGMPITFNYPLEASSVQPTDFLATNEDGSTIQPLCALFPPANEGNEGHTVLMIFENGATGDTMQSIEVVGEVLAYTKIYEGNTSHVEDAQGLTFTSSHPNAHAMNYTSGQILLQARLQNHTEASHDANTGAELDLSAGAQYPNHCSAHFPNTTHVIKLLFHGGTYRDGVNGFLPAEVHDL